MAFGLRLVRHFFLSFFLSPQRLSRLRWAGSRAVSMAAVKWLHNCGQRYVEVGHSNGVEQGAVRWLYSG
jgi:hypothetical protein